MLLLQIKNVAPWSTTGTYQVINIHENTNHAFTTVSVKQYARCDMMSDGVFVSNTSATGMFIVHCYPIQDYLEMFQGARYF